MVKGGVVFVVGARFESAPDGALVGGWGEGEVAEPGEGVGPSVGMSGGKGC
jgi:hypothetical protein